MRIINIPNYSNVTRTDHRSIYSLNLSRKWILRLLGRIPSSCTWPGRRVGPFVLGWPVGAVGRPKRWLCTWRTARWTTAAVRIEVFWRAKRGPKTIFWPGRWPSTSICNNCSPSCNCNYIQNRPLPRRSLSTETQNEKNPKNLNTNRLVRSRRKYTVIIIL